MSEEEKTGGDRKLPKVWECDAFPDKKIGWKIRNDIKGGWMGYTFHPLFSWRARPNVRLETLQTNEYGLRSRSFKDLKSRRSLLLGGSFAWGYGASSNEFTPSYLIENCLSKTYGDEISVINMADQLYCSIQQIQSFIYSMNDLNPELIICITGYNDIAQARAGFYQDNLRYNEYTSFFNWAGETGLMFDGGFFKKLVRFIRRGGKGWTNPFKDNFSFSRPPQDDVPLLLNRLKMDVITGIALRKKIKVAYVLEPALFYKKNLSQYEASYLKTDDARCAYFRKYYDIFKDTIWKDGGGFGGEGIRFIDTTSYLDDCRETLFIDWIHLTDKGFKIWSEKLAAEIHMMINEGK